MYGVNSCCFSLFGFELTSQYVSINLQFLKLFLGFFDFFGERMENKFCYLKGLVDCSSGQIQDCNVKHVSRCPREEDTAKKESRQAFCFLKGLVDCAPCDVQDCNIKRVRRCPREN